MSAFKLQIYSQMKNIIYISFITIFLTTSLIAQEKKHVVQSYGLVSMGGVSFNSYYRIDSGWDEKYTDKVSYGGGLKYSYKLFRIIYPSIGIETQYLNGSGESGDKVIVDLYHIKLGVLIHLYRRSGFEFDLEADYLHSWAEIEHYYFNKWEEDLHKGLGIGVGFNTRYVFNSFSGINLGVYSKGYFLNLDGNRGGSGYINQFIGLHLEYRVGYSFHF